MAGQLMGADKFKVWDEGWRLCINSEERETLLQILNDIRVGCWHALGEPEDLETHTPNPTKKEQVFYNTMNLAGYFEHNLLKLEEVKG